jgi:hypothetical protein
MCTELVKAQGKAFYGDPNEPPESSQIFGKRMCYDSGESDGESERFDQDSADECDMDGENHYENGFSYGCENQRSSDACNAIRLGLTENDS